MDFFVRRFCKGRPSKRETKATRNLEHMIEEQDLGFEALAISKNMIIAGPMRGGDFLEYSFDEDGELHEVKDRKDFSTEYDRLREDV